MKSKFLFQEQTRKKRCPTSPTLRGLFPAEGDPSSPPDSTPVPRGSRAEQLRLSSPHHTVGSFHSWSRGLSSMSCSERFFFLQTLTPTTMQRRTRITPQDTPTASARIAISDMVTEEKTTRSNSVLSAGARGKCNIFSEEKHHSV